MPIKNGNDIIDKLKRKFNIEKIEFVYYYDDYKEILKLLSDRKESILSEVDLKCVIINLTAYKIMNKVPDMTFPKKYEYYKSLTHYTRLGIMYDLSVKFNWNFDVQLREIDDYNLVNTKEVTDREELKLIILNLFADIILYYRCMECNKEEA